MKSMFFLLVFNFFVLSLNAQYIPPPKITNETISYELPELIVKDTMFIHKLDSLVFNSKQFDVNKRWGKYLRIFFIKDYGIVYVELSDICGSALNDKYETIGYLERNSLTYIIRGTEIDNLFIISRHKKRFTYYAIMWGDVDITEDDIPGWILKYEDGQLSLRHPL